MPHVCEIISISICNAALLYLFPLRCVLMIRVILLWSRSQTFLTRLIELSLEIISSSESDQSVMWELVCAVADKYFQNIHVCIRITDNIISSVHYVLNWIQLATPYHNTATPLSVGPKLGSLHEIFFILVREKFSPFDSDYFIQWIKVLAVTTAGLGGAVLAGMNTDSKKKSP